ncbi:MAG: YggS family pyridoxal phosphate-dependent enzyme [Eubacteriaceae bacterium]
MKIKTNLESIKKQIPPSVELVVVSKNRTLDEVQEVVDNGITNLGENRVQQLLSKYDNIKGDVNWHFIGHLQTNKVKYIIDKVCLIHSVDSLKLAQEIQRQSVKHDKITDILIQINVSKEKSKYGINIEEYEDFLESLKQMKNINVKGLMTIAPYTEKIEETRYIFSELKEIYDKIKINEIAYFNVEMKTLSMGMTNDYLIAIDEGSNMIRVGRGVFE